MNEEEAVRLATLYARQQGYDPGQYEIRADRRDGEWLIFFRSGLARPGPGDFFTVYVDDKSRSAQRLVPGK
ncbi:hypothetical protein [Bradyrhizobium sp. 2S1]|uniref:hypothetical protein n=1 Tax=Bradyrhizobium sp. 2S1 TaxID=1404429 RepID=UPI00140B2B24|nr:hypothetical protein [Bradyrhizobium sp. 2S1]MCK7668302.1 hypothetical protein [Bradyrhizobium sp. 2S1]